MSKQMTSDLRIESVIAAVADHNRNAIEHIDSRLEGFLKIFNEAFPIEDDFLRGRVEAITWSLFSSILSLYANQNNGAVLVELYSLIEKFSIRDFPGKITDDKEKKGVIASLIERKNLTDIAPLYNTLGIWDSDDIAFIGKISKIRNGIAHKNEKLISKSINNGKEVHYLDIDSMVNKHDACNYIINSIKIFVKLSNDK
ncbi:hypothetical protein MTX78_05095 [Hymenobacter tibetensis]|uniref:RiboL-PSP-HEPN domain-containing protein n=1 Tax=Hymenobacter tibetensis TaxID=497967 RepID=A0ABY4D135_9BACT|nr:hypothetical protein [Hymenobacter tibetensis]UOG75977.1 hypothetical protein MTX78_05095 [Hymenobacter tibetensis]